MSKSRIKYDILKNKAQKWRELAIESEERLESLQEELETIQDENDDLQSQVYDLMRDKDQENTQENTNQENTNQENTNQDFVKKIERHCLKKLKRLTENHELVLLNINTDHNRDLSRKEDQIIRLQDKLEDVKERLVEWKTSYRTVTR